MINYGPLHKLLQGFPCGLCGGCGSVPGVFCDRGRIGQDGFCEPLRGLYGVFCLHLHRVHDELIEEPQAEAESIKDAIKAHMGDAEELRAREYKDTWKPVTSTRLDSKALKAAAPELVERFIRTTTIRRFCVA